MSTLKGKVKWFNGKKGYGFIEREDGEKDCFVHASSVRDAGLRFLNEGDQTLAIFGEVSSQELELMAHEYIEGLQELGISKPIWPTNAFGVLIFLVTYFIFEESEYARK